MEIKKLLKKSSLSKSMGSSINIVSSCFRVLRKKFPGVNFSNTEWYIRHNILFLKDLPRETNIALYKEKQQILDAINKELAASDFRYSMKDIRTK